MLKLFYRLCQQAFAAVLPATCPGCMAPLPATEPVGFCATCHGKMPWWNTHQVLPPQLPPAIASFTAPCLYAEPLRNAILQLKFHDAVPFVPPLCRTLHRSLQPFESLENTLLIPVPSHRSRIRKRRYNHMALIARNLSKNHNIPCHLTALKRLRPDTPQASKTRAARLKLPASAFHANPKLINNKTIILLDDIYTTGATARACALALRKAGATAVHVVTLAYTKPE